MKKNIIFRVMLVFSIIGVTVFAGKIMLETSAEENITKSKVEKAVQPALVSKEDIESVEFKSVPQSEVQIPLNLESKNIKHITGKARGVIAEKRPDGHLIETSYPTDTGNGDLLVVQSVNAFNSVEELRELVKSWYPEDRGGHKELNLSGYEVIVNENDFDANTLHILTEENIFTVAGQKTELLLEVGQEIINNF